MTNKDFKKIIPDMGGVSDGSGSDAISDDEGFVLEEPTPTMSLMPQNNEHQAFSSTIKKLEQDENNEFQ